MDDITSSRDNASYDSGEGGSSSAISLPLAFLQGKTNKRYNNNNKATHSQYSDDNEEEAADVEVTQSDFKKTELEGSITTFDPQPPTRLLSPQTLHQQQMLMSLSSVSPLINTARPHHQLPSVYDAITRQEEKDDEDPTRVPTQPIRSSYAVATDTLIRDADGSPELGATLFAPLLAPPPRTAEAAPKLVNDVDDEQQPLPATHAGTQVRSTTSGSVASTMSTDYGADAEDPPLGFSPQWFSDGAGSSPRSSMAPSSVAYGRCGSYQPSTSVSACMSPNPGGGHSCEHHGVHHHYTHHHQHGQFSPRHDGSGGGGRACFYCAVSAAIPHASLLLASPCDTPPQEEEELSPS